MTERYAPQFGNPVSDWFRWFAWHPVQTIDRGWRWLVPVWRRRIYNRYNDLYWFQNVVKK